MYINTRKEVDMDSNQGEKKEMDREPSKEKRTGNIYNRRETRKSNTMTVLCEADHVRIR